MTAAVVLAVGDEQAGVGRSEIPAHAAGQHLGGEVLRREVVAGGARNDDAAASLVLG